MKASREPGPGSCGALEAFPKEMKPREGAQQGREPLAGHGDRLWGQRGSEEAATWPRQEWRAAGTWRRQQGVGGAGV